MSKFDFKSRMPIPMGFDTECKRGARIIDSFLKPGALDTNKLIPASILERARGIAFLSVIKAGFIWSGRLGSGLVVARNPRVVAKYNFAGDQPTDLPFNKGDIIIVTKHDGNANSWWEGKCNGKEGSFPSNFLEETSLESMELLSKQNGH
ncbi:SH3 domain-containing YSC84-like protein 1 [Coemansia sp. RSA 2131]|nr:SH3 domain-containing YSC84-like protein 1 [Coemansia sp. RSA 2131]